MADSFEGTWKLNLAKSTGTLPAAETVVIQQQNQSLVVEVSIVTGAPANAAFVIKYAAPASGGEGKVEKGPYNGVTFQRLGPRSLETVYSIDRKKVRSTRAVVSPDGKSMTSTGKTLGVDSHAEWQMFFDKQ